MFIESFSAYRENRNTFVQPCILLYGATGTGKSSFLRAIENIATNDVEVVRFDGRDNEPFIKRFSQACQDAQNRYNSTHKRTILLMDDAEKYFAMPLGDAQNYYKNELDAADMKKIESICTQGTNSHVKDFKAFLDVLSQIPDDNDPWESAMSIFITTNHPNIIDRQLIKRPEKMDTYHVGSAQKKNLNDVINFYFEDKKRILDKLKLFADRDDMAQAIDGITGIDEDAKNKLKEYFSQGKADKYNIDISSVDFDALTKYFQPSEELGAFSNVMLKAISYKAFYEYLKNPEDPYQTYFYEQLCKSNRDIEPQRYAAYLKTANMVSLFKSENTSEKDMDEFVDLLYKRNNKLIRSKDKDKLESYLQSIKIRIQELLNKKEIGTISENELDELDNLQEQYSYSENPEKIEKYKTEHKF